MGQLYIKHLPDRSARGPRAGNDRRRSRAACSQRPSISIGPLRRARHRPDPCRCIFPTAELRQAAREVARETFVLLQNRGECCRSHPRRAPIAVIGPLADAPRDQFGPHGARGHAEDSVSVLREFANAPRSPASTYAMLPVATSCAGIPTACCRRRRRPRASDLILADFWRAAGAFGRGRVAGPSDAERQAGRDPSRRSQPPENRSSSC